MSNKIWAFILSTIMMLFVADFSSASGIKYFGFYQGIVYSGANVSSGTNILLQPQSQNVANFTNTIWILDGSIQQVQADLNLAASKGQNAVIDVGFIFFNQTNGVISYNPNWASQWNAFVNAIGPLKSSIAAFYPLDEPNIHGETAAQASIINLAIHSSFPGIPVAVIYSEGADSTTAKYFDWVGFDCYTNGQFKCQSGDYTANYSRLKSMLSPSQKIIIVTQSGLPNSNAGCCISALAAENNRLFQLAYGDPQVIGIFSFIWQSTTNPNWTGLNGLATLQPTVMNIGSAVKSSWSYPSGIAPVFRFTKYNSTSDHLFTLVEQEGVNAAIPGQYTFEGIGFSVYSTQQPGSYPLYRCVTQYATHFVAGNVPCTGYTNEGILGYVMSSQTSNTVPLYRFFNTSNGSHLTTTNYQEGVNAGLQYEGILGYSPVVNY